MPSLRKSFAEEVDGLGLSDGLGLPRKSKKVAFNPKNTMSFSDFAQEIEKEQGTGANLGIADWVLLPGCGLCEEDFAIMSTVDASDAEDLPLLEEEEFFSVEEVAMCETDLPLAESATKEEAMEEESGRRLFGANDYDLAEVEDRKDVYTTPLTRRVEAFVSLYWSHEADEWERKLVNFKRAKQWNQIVHNDFQRSKKRTRKPRVRTRMLRRLNDFGGRPGCEPYISTYEPSHFVKQRQEDDLQRAIAASMREAVNMTARESLRAAARPATTLLPCGLTAQQVHDLSTREMTPEDYELLLLLDEQVKPKTVSQTMIDGYDHSSVTEESLQKMTAGDDDQCMVCLTEYCAGEELITLPCKHYFHAGCITHWLTASSTKCPLDGLSLLEE